MQIVEMHASLNRLVTMIIRFAVDKAGFDTTTSQQGAKALLLMLAAMFD